MKNSIEYAKLSGISIPDNLKTAKDEALTRLSTVKDKKTELAGRKVALQDEIRDLVRLEASALVDTGGDSKLAKKCQKAEEALSSTGQLLGEMDGIEAKARAGLSQAEAALEGHINDCLQSGRAVMRRQLDAAMSQRGRQLGSLRAGEVPRSTPPEESSQSRIAVCESCGKDLAIIGDDICQPVTSASFEKLPGFDHLPFHPQAELKYFRCPYCQRIPWGEDNLVLTNMGYRIIPEQQEEETNG